MEECGIVYIKAWRKYESRIREETMFCVKCGAEVFEGYNFCMKCGSKIEVTTYQGIF